MTKTHCALLVSGIFLISVASSAVTYSVDETPPDKTVSVKQFGRARVIGHLGHPLGTFVRVTGTCVDGETTRRRADVGKTILRIETVNGMALERQFEFLFERAAKNILKPKPGDKFDFYVHEWGSFDGIVEVPKGLGIEKPNVATDGFHYRPEITIHKTNSELNRPAVQSRGRTRG